MTQKKPSIIFDKNAMKFLKYNDSLHTLNVYQIPRKEDQVVHF